MSIIFNTDSTPQSLLQPYVQQYWKNMGFSFVFLVFYSSQTRKKFYARARDVIEKNIHD